MPTFSQDLSDLQAQKAAEDSQLAAYAATIDDLRNQLKRKNMPVKWGSSVWVFPGETYPQALARVEAALAPALVREYLGEGVVPTWPTRTGTHNLNISFKLLPSQVLSGTYDAQLKAFFDATPRETYWTYWHECESAVKQGKFTTADFRAAWAHIAAIARASAGAPLLHATLVLMGYTLTAASGRNWLDYYPGADQVDVLAWDCYIWSATDTPANAFDAAHATSVTAGKPWAIAECGVGAVQFPVEADRDAMLKSCAAHLSSYAETPVFVEYFDSQPGGTTDGYKWPISNESAASAAWKQGQTA